MVWEISISLKCDNICKSSDWKLGKIDEFCCFCPTEWPIAWVPVVGQFSWNFRCWIGKGMTMNNSNCDGVRQGMQEQPLENLWKPKISTHAGQNYQKCQTDRLCTGLYKKMLARVCDIECGRPKIWRGIYMVCVELAIFLDKAVGPPVVYTTHNDAMTCLSSIAIQFVPGLGYAREL